ncbi:predicted protein [Thalassiosira pseudonana CCMP1335]|uniref:Uncharacterized protein n=1 Tax=Thalassiosira pseudonana TaxID=35128 RepID=B8CG94_THAPS|nr:predicted protein [Thalassiosira pseudonana CCMP1335]EED87453.1 predicted protein [Thalassiosira pseudonana CCMP1335]
MFVKKDQRKVPQILSDATSRVNTPPDTASGTKDGEGEGSSIVRELSFARRAPEFLPARNVSLLLQPSYRPALDHLVQLSLYDCGLKTLVEISRDGLDEGVTLFPKLEQLDIGRNPLLTNDSVSAAFHTQFPSLLELWCDNCSFGPVIPPTMLKLHGLEVVRMTGNKLEGVLEEGIGAKYWKQVKILALDGNALTSVGTGLGELTQLEKLHLRQNKLTSLPEGVPSAHNSNLVMLSLSSNKLISVPASLLDTGSSLKELYLNGNQITEVPEFMGEKLVVAKKLNLAHNKIGEGSTAVGEGDVEMEGNENNLLPRDFVERFGMPDVLSGNCTKDEQCIVLLEGNPFTEARRKKHLDEERRKAKEAEMEVDAEA